MTLSRFLKTVEHQKYITNNLELQAIAELKFRD